MAQVIIPYEEYQELKKTQSIDQYFYWRIISTPPTKGIPLTGNRQYYLNGQRFDVKWEITLSEGEIE